MLLSFLISPSWCPSPLAPPLLLWEGGNTPSYPPTRAHQVLPDYSGAFPLRPDRASMKTELHFCCIFTKGPPSSPYMSFGCWWLRFWELPGVQICWLCWSFCGIPIISRLSIHSPTSIDVPNPCIMFDYWYRHLFQSAAGHSLSEGSYARLQTPICKYNRVSLTMSGTDARP